MSSSAVFPGTFDPITYGHLDVIRRGAKLFDKLIIGVGDNPRKDTIFSAQERVQMVRTLVEDTPNIVVGSFSGMTVDFVKQHSARAILRGIRTFADFEYEFQLAIANRRIAGIETVFVMASAENSFIRSTLIREACTLGGDVSAFVPPAVEKLLIERVQQKPPQHGVGLGGEGAPQAGEDKKGLFGEAID